jgi:hypothetical protein
MHAMRTKKRLTRLKRPVCGRDLGDVRATSRELLFPQASKRQSLDKGRPHFQEEP